MHVNCSVCFGTTESCLESKPSGVDVRIYNRALSPTEVQQLYKLGAVIVRPN